MRGKVILAAMRKLFPDAGIDLPFPTTQVLFHDQTEVTDGDRAKQREGWPAGDTIPAPRYAARVKSDNATKALQK